MQSAPLVRPGAHHLDHTHRTKMPAGPDPRSAEYRLDTAKKMFYGGFALLPWLWVVNLLWHGPEALHNRDRKMMLCM